MHQQQGRAWTDVDVRACIGEAIAVRRVQLGMSQAEVAVLLGWHPGTLSRLERGGAPATVTMLTRVAPVLHTAPWLLVAQAVGAPQERHMAAQIHHVMETRPAVWRTVRALMCQSVGETVG